MRVVLDANVLASGFLRSNPRATPFQMVEAWRRGAFELVISEHLLAEVLRTFREPYFREHLTRAQASRAAALLRYQATQTAISVQVHGVATHPEDDLILATAVSAKVDYLVSGDAKLQALEAYEGILIVSPHAFLAILQVQTEP